jgi:hypothetical protein
MHNTPPANSSPYDLYFQSKSPSPRNDILISQSMVVPPPSPNHSPPQPRPQWGRGGSWRKYIKLSNRKLLSDGSNNNSTTISEQKRVSIDESSNCIREIPPVELSDHDVIWYKVRVVELVACGLYSGYWWTHSFLVDFLRDRKVTTTPLKKTGS